MRRHAFLYVIRQLVEIAPVGFRKNQFHDADAPRRNDFLAQPADRQDFTGQGQLAGHGERAGNFLVAGQRQQRGGHGDTCARTVLGRRAFRHMQVDKRFVEKRRVALVCLEVRRYVAVGDLRRFAHHFAELAGKLEAAVLGVHQGCFDRQRGAAHCRPSQARHHADAGDRPFRHEHRLAKICLDLIDTQTNWRFNSADDLHRRLAYHAAELLFQIPHPRLTRKAFNDALQRGFCNGEIAALQPSLLELFRPQVVLGDLHLLGGDVAR